MCIRVRGGLDDDDDDDKSRGRIEYELSDICVRVRIRVRVRCAHSENTHYIYPRRHCGATLYIQGTRILLRGRAYARTHARGIYSFGIRYYVQYVCMYIYLCMCCRHAGICAHMFIIPRSRFSECVRNVREELVMYAWPSLFAPPPPHIILLCERSRCARRGVTRCAKRGKKRKNGGKQKKTAKLRCNRCPRVR